MSDFEITVTTCAGHKTVSFEDAEKLMIRIAELEDQLNRPVLKTEWQQAQDRIAELEAQLAEAQKSKEFYSSRVDKFQQYQSGMRDPERTLVCDIIANNSLLPDKSGKRYGSIVNTAMESE